MKLREITKIKSSLEKNNEIPEEFHMQKRTRKHPIRAMLLDHVTKGESGITLIALIVTIVISYDNIKKRWYNKVFAPQTF